MEYVLIIWAVSVTGFTSPIDISPPPAFIFPSQDECELAFDFVSQNFVLYSKEGPVHWAHACVQQDQT